MAWAVAAAALTLILVTRPAISILVPSLRKGFSYKLVFLVFGILSFQTVLELSGAITRISLLAQQYSLPPEALIILVCFSIGLLTGMVAAYVGMGYAPAGRVPLTNRQSVPGISMLAYLSGYVGMLLAPTHLCLVLTNNYFKSNLMSVYRLIILPLFILALLGFFISQSLWGDLFIPN